MERPVPSDCAETARSPAVSSSVKEARNTACTLAKNSITRRALVGPKPGVRAMASHCMDVSVVELAEATASDTTTSRGLSGHLYTAGNRCQGQMNIGFVRMNQFLR